MTDKPLPGHDKQPDEIICSSCGRFVGALTRCPHCGARVNKRLTIKVTRFAALVLAIVGLVLLYLMATHRELPIVKVGELKPTMNFAAVRMEGTVSSDARVFRQGGRVKQIRFDLDDGTGEIPVTAYSAQAQRLIDDKKLPRMGDHVEVSGSLNVSSEREALRLQSPDQLILTPAELPVSIIGDLENIEEGGSVLIEGTITAVRQPRAGGKMPWSITLSDDTGDAAMSFWEDTYAEIEEKALVAVGSRVRVRASVGSYKGNLQLRLAHGDDLRFAGRDESVKQKASTREKSSKASYQRSEAITLEEVTADLKGDRIETEGVVVEVITPKAGSKAPHKIILEDGDARVSVVYWDKVAQQMKKTPAAGSRIQVRGTVDEYKGEVQLKVSFADQIMMGDDCSEAEAAEEAVSAGPVAVKDIDDSMLGQIVTVTGTLGEPRSIGSGVIHTLSDGDAIEVVMWDKAVPGDARNGLEIGASVTISGEVKEYKGKLQIVPRSAQDIAEGGQG